MAHWIAKKEWSGDGDGECDNIVFVSDNGLEVKTMFDVGDDYLASLKQGIHLTPTEQHTINFLSANYNLTTAIDVVTAFRFKNVDDVVVAKFMLAPNLTESRRYLEYVDSFDIKDLLNTSNFSGRKYAKEIEEPERTINNRLNEFNNKTCLSFSQKFTAMVLTYTTNKS